MNLTPDTAEPSQSHRNAESPSRLIELARDQHERASIPLALGANLRSLRRRASLSQVDLAARSYLRHDHIAAFEQGKYPPTLLVLLTISDALHASIAEIAEGVPSSTRQPESTRALSIITSHPGITTKALADEMGVPAWYLTQILHRLESLGAINGPMQWMSTQLTRG